MSGDVLKTINLDIFEEDLLEMLPILEKRQRDYLAKAQAIIPKGASTSSLNAFINCAPSAPSIAR